MGVTRRLKIILTSLQFCVFIVPKSLFPGEKALSNLIILPGEGKGASERE